MFVCMYVCIMCYYVFAGCLGRDCPSDLADSGGAEAEVGGVSRSR